jgi:hypothetical protein
MKRPGRYIVLLLLCAATLPGALAWAENIQVKHPGDALRSRLGIHLPTSDTMVIIYAVAQHHTRTEWSVVAWRSEDGNWTIERGGEESSGLLSIQPHLMRRSKATLSAGDAAKLDHLLRQRDVYREKVTGGKPAVGGYFNQMEIITPERSLSANWTGRLVGKLGRIADIVIGPG